MEGFGRQKGAGTRKSQTKARIISGEVLSFAGRGRLGVCHYGDLTNAGQEIPGCFKMPLLGEAGPAVRLGEKFWFAHVKLCTNYSTWGLCFLFFNNSLFLPRISA